MEWHFREELVYSRISDAEALTFYTEALEQRPDEALTLKKEKLKDEVKRRFGFD